MSEAKNNTLYHRMGGYDVIAAFTDDLLERLVQDSQIGAYWKGKCKDSMRRDRQLLVDFLCAATGGPAVYCGRDMKTSHEGLGITEGDWEVFVKHTVAALEKCRVPEREKAEFLATAGMLKSQIVGG